MVYIVSFSFSTVAAYMANKVVYQTIKNSRPGLHSICCQNAFQRRSNSIITHTCRIHRTNNSKTGKTYAKKVIHSKLSE